MDKLARMALLYDFYSPLLTEKQRDSLDLYYQQDLSLGEIAEESGISRQAVHDLLRRTEKILIEYEDKLKLVERFIDREEKLLQIRELTDQLSDVDALVAQRMRLIVDELLAGD